MSLESEALRIAGNSQVLDEVAERLVANIQEGMIPHNITGHLSESWAIEKRVFPDGSSDRLVSTDVEYAEYFENGHRAADGSLVEPANVVSTAIAKTKAGL